MLYLIGGVLKSGKTYLARKIMEENKIPYFSTDFLNYALSDDGMFNHYDNDEDVSVILEPYILKIVDFLIKYESDYVIEGAHITPRICNIINEKYPSKTKSVILGYSNADAKEKYESVLRNEDGNESIWYKTLSKESFIDLINDKIKLSNKLKNVCLKDNIKYYDVEDINESYNDIINYLLNR